MLRNWKKLLAAAAMLAGAPWVMAFTPLAPGGGEGVTIKNWQLPPANAGWSIGYNLAGDIGAPADLLAAYRWNTPVVTYAFDEDFVRYFGTSGIKAVDETMRILNDLPPASKMSEDLSEFPLSSAHLNYEAAQLGLLDLKSVALQFMMEEIGLADPLRWNFSIRHRTIFPPGSPFGIYDIIKFNYDPVSLRSSSYINGTLWTYQLFEFPVPRISFLFPVPATTGNDELNYPVAAFDTFLPVFSGYYYTGLTRDDVGGIRFLLNPRNIVAETLLAGTVPGGGGVWNPFVGTNFTTNIVAIGTNNPASVGLRGGVNKIRFRKVFFDSLLGRTFTPVTIDSPDNVIIGNGQVIKQTVRRTVALPDIIFTVQDTYPAAFGARTTTAGWLNNDALNGVTLLGGPGVINPPVVITFNTQNPILVNQTPFFVTEPSITDTNSRFFGLVGPVWASFDGSTNAPIIYPEYLHYNINDIRNAARQINP